MLHPTVLSTPTRLFHPAEPEGRVFQTGEPWPGDAWSAKPGGEPAGVNANAGLLKDLIEANDRLDAQGQALARNAFDLGVMATERDAANDRVAGLEQRAIAAEAAQTTAEDAAKGYMGERDQARADAADKSAKLDEATAAIADLTAQVETLTAPKKAAKADA